MAIRAHITALSLALTLLVCACAHTPAQRSKQVARTAAGIAGGVVLMVGVGLLVGLIVECEQPQGNCRDPGPDRSR